MIEIAIDELETCSDRTAYVNLPANKNTVTDEMDKACVFGETFPRIENCDDFSELNGFEFDEEPTVQELNFLAKRLEEISKDVTLKCAYKALLQKPMSTVNEAINRIYNLETIPVFPCKNYEEYGEIVLENEMLEELEDIPDELYELLDADKVGRVMAEREGGVFIDGYYVVTDSYEPVLIYDEELPEAQEDWLFKLEVTGVPENPEDISKIKGEILTLPANEEYMRELASRLGEKRLEDCIYFDFQSSIPQINEDFLDSMEDIFTLNDIAKRCAKLSRIDAAKFKAILELEGYKDIEKVENILNNLDEYEFDASLTEPSDYGINYLSKMLPPDFDRTLLESINATNFAFKVMSKNKCAFTEYGVVSGRGGHLYSMIEAPRQDEVQSLELSL